MKITDEVLFTLGVNVMFVHDPLEKLGDIADLLEKPATLEIKLTEVADLIAQILQTKRCSILLLTEEDTFSPFIAYRNGNGSKGHEAIALEQIIANYVVNHRKPLLCEDVYGSFLPQMERKPRQSPQGWMSAPILEDYHVIGVINVSSPLQSQGFKEEDLQFLSIFSAFMGKSLKICQLQSILRSKFIERAVSREYDDFLVKESLDLHPNKLAKIIAKSFFKELNQAGFGANEVISIATEVLSLLNTNLEKHRQRLAREDND